MIANISQELADLRKMNVKDLQYKYAQVFAEPTRTHNRVWLLKRIAWRLQALAEGGLSERARQRAAELANDADLRRTPPKTDAPTAMDGSNNVRSNDDRLPPPGTVITRRYKGGIVEVKILQDGFEYGGEVFGSLSAVAKTITGQHWNGYHFFGLRRQEAKRAAS